MDSQSSSRKAYEAGFWDRQVSQAGGFRRRFYGEVNRRLWKQIFAELGDLAGKRVLFVGCGTASGAASELAERGAEVWCVDISPGSIEKLKAHPFGPAGERIHPVVADAEDMPFADGSFDVVLGKAIVHHLDIDRFLAEIDRVCAAGARLVFSEPLAANPIVRLFRKLTPSARVPTEHPLTRRDLKNIASHCTSLRRRYNFVLALGSLPWFFLPLGPLARLLFKVGCAADRLLLAVFPPARPLAWNVTLTGRLPQEER